MNSKTTIAACIGAIIGLLLGTILGATLGIVASRLPFIVMILLGLLLVIIIWFGEYPDEP